MDPVGAPRTPRRSLFKVALFTGGSLLAAAVFLFTNQMVGRLSKEVSTTSRVLAKFCAQASIPATTSAQLDAIFKEVLAGIDFPMVITDTTGTPRAWRDVGVHPDSVSTEAIDSVAAGMPVDPRHARRIEQVRARIPAMDQRNPPIPMTALGSQQVLGSVHYGEPAVLARLRWMPWLAVGGTGLLLLLALGGLAGIRAAERRTIWVGMAKETAHQLGTPLSSLMGWIELLREQEVAAPAGPTVAVPRAELTETLDDMERDIERLSKVAQRFSHIGSTPQLQLQDVVPVVREAVAYMRRRMVGAGDLELRERYEDVPPINANRELLEWAVENLLSNAATAIDKKPGVIEVVVQRRPRTEEVEILVIDNGRGMSREEQRRAFEPGYTTKRRGWGLGLALSRRVIEDYHAGRLRIAESVPGQGTTMAIRFGT